MIKNRKQMFIIIGVFALILFLGGTTYAWFNYRSETGEQELIAGDIYLTLTEGNEEIELSNIFPETPEEARARDDNYITFTIEGVNTSNKDIYYEFILDHGTEKVSPKSRYRDQDLRFDLIEISGNNETYLLSAVNYDSLENQRIYVNTIDASTSSEVERHYKLRMWLDENVIISDTAENKTYTTTEYPNKYATIKLIVAGDFQEKMADNPGSAPLSLSESNGSVQPLDSITISIIAPGDGTLSCTSSDANVATCSISGTNLIISGVSNGNAIITVNQTVSTGYLRAGSVTFNVAPFVTINYNANGGTVSPQIKQISSLSETYGELVEPTPATGYVFLGWFTDEEEGQEVTASTSYIHGVSPTTLYAHWRIQTAADKISEISGLQITPYGKVYSGASANNYVSFNGETWRIIGVYTDEVNGDKLKIIRNTPSTTNQQYNDSNSNTWSGSALQIYLNNTYYSSLSSSAKEMVYESSTWNVGSASKSNNASESYTKAQNTTFVGKVGVIASYEYYYAASNNGTCWSTAGSAFYNNNCSSKDWLYPILTSSKNYIGWLSTPDETYNRYSLGVASNNGNVSSNSVGGYIAATPVIFLKSEVVINGGTGKSAQNAYTLEYNSGN